jgi:glycosyltransferase involved in cell wall biosynthesis
MNERQSAFYKLIPFDIEFGELPAPTLLGRTFILEGFVRVLASHPVSVNEIGNGSLKLGCRITADGGQTYIFETRAQLAKGELHPGERVHFTVYVDAIDLPEFCVQVDFLYEGEFWFGDAGGEPPCSIDIKPRSVEVENNEAPLRDTQRPMTSQSWPSNIARRADTGKHRDSVDSGIRYVCDISDLIQFWRSNIYPTGIQRVQIEVIRSLIPDVTAQISDDRFCVLLYYDVRSSDWFMIDEQLFLQQVDASNAPNTDIASWKLQLDRLLLATITYMPAADDVLINLGSSWWIPDYLYKINLLRRTHGVRYVPFIHDTIPLSTPEYCATDLVDEFRMWFRGAVEIADHIIVNSQSSANDVTVWAKQLTGDCPPVSVAPLNAAFSRTAKATRSHILQKHNLDIDRYVLCVGTLEIRKNHLLLLNVWNELARRFEGADVPKLVLVGKKGWMFEEAEALLARNAVLAAHVLILSNLSDQELAEVYQNCQFAVYPSFYEGWGLPVTEAVSYGKLTVASNTSSIPEAASSGDILLPPHDQAAWLDMIARLLQDDAFLARATAASREQARLRDWAAIAGDILAAASGERRAERQASLPLMADGVIYDFRISTAKQDYERSAGVFRHGPGWHHLEAAFTWTAGPVTELKFSVATAEPRYLYLGVLGGLEDTGISISTNGRNRKSFALARDTNRVFRLSLPATLHHTIRLLVDQVLDLSELTRGADTRKVGVRFVNLMCCLEGDIVARLGFSEEMGMSLV